MVSDCERARLVRVCARLSGDAEAAEDLAQETLLIAWRKQSSDIAPSMAWLTGIASNVARDWTRRHKRESSRVVRLQDMDDMPADRSDEFDIEVDLEREELVALLERALALLPPHARLLLIQQYIEELPRSEIASRWGLTEGAVAVRLHRGRLALKRILQRETRGDAETPGLIPQPGEAPERTRIWCLRCGRHRFEGRFEPETGWLTLACPACFPSAGGHIGAKDPQLFAGLKSCRPALNRLLSGAHAYYSDALRSGSALCSRCGRPAVVSRDLSHLSDPPLPSVEVICRSCGAVLKGAISLLFFPETIRFWRRNPRMRLLPPRSVAVAGGDAIVTGFESVTSAHRIECVLAQDNGQTLSIMQ